MRGLEAYLPGWSSRVAKTDFKTVQCQSFCCSKRQGEEELFASFDEIAFDARSEVFRVWVLRKLTKGTHELDCGHVKELCKNVCILFLSATAARFSFDKKLSDRRYPCVLSSQVESF